MKAVLTGDIVHSREVPVTEWLAVLKDVLVRYGKSPQEWEIYRGDSFQLCVVPEKGLEAVLKLKAALKQFKALDVRIGLGIGEVSFQGNKVTESNGEAFRHSGHSFDALKKKTLNMQTPWEEVNEKWELLFDLATLTMDAWTPVTATIIYQQLLQPEANQKALAEQLEKSQGNISEGLKRGGFDEIKKLLHYYQKEMKHLCRH